MGQIHTFPIITKLNHDLELVAVCDLDKGRVQEQAEKYNVPGYTDTEEMLTQIKTRYLLYCYYSK